MNQGIREVSLIGIMRIFQSLFNHMREKKRKRKTHLFQISRCLKMFQFFIKTIYDWNNYNVINLNTYNLKFHTCFKRYIVNSMAFCNITLEN